MEAWDPSNVSIFSTRNQESKTDAYFLDSASGVSFFFEEKAFDKDGQLAVPKQHAVNKIGHGKRAGRRRNSSCSAGASREAAGQSG